MSYTMADFRRDNVKEQLKHMTPEERREVWQILTPGERREILRGLSPKERLAGLSPEERLAGLSPGEITEYLQRLHSERPSGNGKPRRKS